MEMKDFASKIRDSVRDGLGDGYKVDVKEVNKNNSVVRNGLVILAQGQNVAPTIYLEDFLEAYESGMPLETVVQQMLDAYRRSMPADGLDMDFFRHFEKVRDRICFRLIGKKGNEALLEKIPYIDFLDLAICFYYAYQDECLGEGSILIYNSHVEMWGTNAFELMSTARRNTPRLLPWTCCSLAEAMDAAGRAGRVPGGAADESAQQHEAGTWRRMHPLSWRAGDAGAGRGMRLLYPPQLHP